jgi:hypothetical protein
MADTDGISSHECQQQGRQGNSVTIRGVVDTTLVWNGGRTNSRDANSRSVFVSWERTIRTVGFIRRWPARSSCSKPRRRGSISSLLKNGQRESLDRALVAGREAATRSRKEVRVGLALGQPHADVIATAPTSYSRSWWW